MNIQTLQSMPVNFKHIQLYPSRECPTSRMEWYCVFSSLYLPGVQNWAYFSAMFPVESCFFMLCWLGWCLFHWHFRMISIKAVKLWPQQLCVSHACCHGNTVINNLQSICHIVNRWGL